MFLQIVYFDWI